MFAIIFLPLLVWGVGNHAYFERLTAAEWDYVGVQERRPGPQPDGAYALTMESEGETFILYKQRAESPKRGPGRTLAGAD